VETLLTAARERPTQSLAGRELRVEVTFAALFVLVAVALLALLPSPRDLSVPTAVALTLLYAIASRVEFESGVGSTVPTQLVFVPMLFVLPTAAVPLFVAAGLLLGRLPRYLTGYTPVNRAVVEPTLRPSAIGRSTCSRSPPSSPGTSRSRALASGWGSALRRPWRFASSDGSVSPTRCCRASGCSSASPPPSIPTRFS
jgi:hypothetical protein